MKLEKPFLIGIVLLAALSRLLPHPDNMTPHVALMLFGSVHFKDRWQAMLVPIASLWISSWILDNFVLRAFYPEQSGIIWYSNLPVYGALLLIFLFSRAFLQKFDFKRLGVAAILSSLIFFLVTNCVWLGSSPGLYPRTWSGQWLSYAAALPFFRNSLIGDLLYSFGIFLAFAWIMKQRGIAIRTGK